MVIKKLLFPTKFQELAFNALECLLDMKKIGLEEIVLAHVIDREEVGFVPYGGYLKEEEIRMREEAQIRFEDWQKALVKRGLRSKIRIEVGNPIPEVLRIADEEGVDLIVAGRKNRSNLEKAHIGSHTLELMRHSSLPVLICKYMVQYERQGERVTQVNEHPFRRPLLATDWSPNSRKALTLAASFKGLAEKILVAHVIEAKICKGCDASEVERLKKESNERLAAYCRELEQQGLAAEAHLYSGPSVPALIDLSREQKATMIIMGTTGKDRFREFWLGSVSHRVAEFSELPVLLVP
ncbi:MAG: universal stress protein [Deltaproteobacteria bacterium]|nr:universal stress protein [Deltaproteobacteria bacterium]